MARCSCAGSSCSCSVTAGAGLQVTGTGTADNPFVIALAPTPSSYVPAAGVLDLSQAGASAIAAVSLTGNVTSLLLPSNGTRLDLIFTQDATGGRTVAWPASVLFPGGADPALTAAANAVSWVALVRASAATWVGALLGANLS